MQNIFGYKATYGSIVLQDALKTGFNSSLFEPMNLRNHIEYSATKAVLGVCRILPAGMIHALFRGFALALYHGSAKRRNLSLDNLEIAFPDKPLDERRQLARKSFINLSESLAFNAMIMCGRITDEQILECVEVEDWERIRNLILNSDKGLVFISGHLGNWELMLQYWALQKLKPAHLIARESNNPLLEEKVVMPSRERFGINIIYKKNATLKLVKALKRGDATGLMIDQRLNKRTGIKVDFFGKPAWTTNTPALLQIKFHPTTLPAFMVRLGKERYKLIVGDPVEWSDNGKPEEEQIRELTMIHQGILEDIIRRHPDQWFWMHDRWRLARRKQ